MHSATGRGYPDFSAQEMNFQAIVNGHLVIVPLRVFPGSCSSTYCGIKVRPNPRKWWYISYDIQVHRNML